MIRVVKERRSSDTKLIAFWCLSGPWYHARSSFKESTIPRSEPGEYQGFSKGSVTIYWIDWRGGSKIASHLLKRWQRTCRASGLARGSGDDDEWYLWILLWAKDPSFSKYNTNPVHSEVLEVQWELSPLERHWSRMRAGDQRPLLAQHGFDVTARSKWTALGILKYCRWGRSVGLFVGLPGYQCCSSLPKNYDFITDHYVFRGWSDQRLSGNMQEHTNPQVVTISLYVLWIQKITISSRSCL